MPSERDGEDQAEGEGRAAEERRQHAVPDQLHQEEGEADDRGGGEDEHGGGVAACGLAPPQRRTCSLGCPPPRAMASRDHRHDRVHQHGDDSVFRLPNISSIEKVESSVPVTAPRVFAP